MMGWYGHWGWGWPFGGFFSLLVLIFLFVLLARLVGHAGWSARSEALTILEQRYAKGEINRDEYLEKKKDLSR